MMERTQKEARRVEHVQKGCGGALRQRLRGGGGGTKSAHPEGEPPHPLRPRVPPGGAAARALVGATRLVRACSTVSTLHCPVHGQGAHDLVVRSIGLARGLGFAHLALEPEGPSS